MRRFFFIFLSLYIQSFCAQINYYNRIKVSTIHSSVKNESKKKNTRWNGSLGGSTQINQINPFLNSISHLTIPRKTNNLIINEYTEVLNLDVCKNALTVFDASKYNTGDTVLMIQMKGAVIDSTNTANFGNITDYKSSGNYEFNIIKQKSGNTITLLNILKRQYNIPDGKVQLIRVPYYQNLTTSSVLTCLPWDGSKGGVIVLNVANSLKLNSNIDVSETGFQGGVAITDPNVVCSVTDYFTPGNAEMYAAAKGESILNTNTFLNGRGKLASGGGGGSASNSGGAGGGNGGIGGNGGNQFPTACGEVVNGGIGGSNLQYTNILNKIFMGGGGGAGQENDNPALAPGGNGGGIAIINCGYLTSNGFSIVANGESPVHLTGTNEDGRSGGGAGGTILLNYYKINDALTVSAKGGVGDYCTPPPPLSHHGPGGGGGGGVLWINQISNDPHVTDDLSGGVNGTNTNLGNDPHGATPGIQGLVLNNLVIPIATVLFKQNIDSVRIKDHNYDCSNVNFQGLGYTQISAINIWNWDFGDGKTSNAQNLTYVYPSGGNYTVKLIGTDINGCKDSFEVPVTIKNINVTKSPDTSLCGSSPVKIFATGGSTYSWIPTTGLSNPGISNPVATPLVSTNYYVTVSNAEGCSKKDSVKIMVNNFPVVSKSKDTIICKNSKVPLLVSGGSTYIWTPAISLSNPNIANPIATPLTNTTYNVKVTSVDGCSKTASINVNIKPIPTITKSDDTTICNKASLQLFVSGGNYYVWSPASSLNNITISTPLASPKSSTVYQVSITDANSCTTLDSIKVTVRPPIVFSVSQDNSVCTNDSQQLSASGGDSYTWIPANSLDKPNTSNPIATPDQTTTYSVTIKENTCNESAILSTKLTVLPIPNIQAASSNNITCKQPSSRLSALGAQDYSWFPATGLDNSAIANPVASPDVYTVYTVTGKDANGCVNSDTVSVNVDYDKNTLYVLPNSFTPNGDNINDCFGIKYWGQVNNLDFSIYNRFGERIFYTNNSSVCWDGTFKGEPQDANVFVYIIKAKTACGYIERKGTVMLLR